MNINYEAAHGLRLMKYTLNHEWKFKYPYTAFASGFLQVLSTVFTACVCYIVIISSADILELAKDFTALMIIIDFDNYFANTSSDDITKDIIDNAKSDGVNNLYSDIFTIETTTSTYARQEGNAKLEEIDEANELVNKRIEHMNKYPKKMFCCKRDINCCHKKSYVKRPKKIAITLKKRCNHFGRCNSLLYYFYRLIRVAFVIVWFYYLPIVVIVISNFTPVYLHWNKIEGCDEKVEQNCVGAAGVSPECEVLCLAYLPEDALKVNF